MLRVKGWRLESVSTLTINSRPAAMSVFLNPSSAVSTSSRRLTSSSVKSAAAGIELRQRQDFLHLLENVSAAVENMVDVLAIDRLLCGPKRSNPMISLR
jgi:hypothetical protein